MKIFLSKYIVLLAILPSGLAYSASYSAKDAQFFGVSYREIIAASCSRMFSAATYSFLRCFSRQQEKPAMEVAIAQRDQMSKTPSPISSQEKHAQEVGLGCSDRECASVKQHQAADNSAEARNNGLQQEQSVDGFEMVRNGSVFRSLEPHVRKQLVQDYVAHIRSGVYDPGQYDRTPPVTSLLGIAVKLSFLNFLGLGPK